MNDAAVTGSVEIAILGDVHGDFDPEKDVPLLRRFPAALCTGDLTPNDGPDRFDVALRVAAELREAGVLTVLGNHDGPSCFTGRRFPESYLALVAALGPCDASARRVELPALDLTIVGARPLTCGGPRIRFAPPGRESWTMARWADEIGGLVAAAEASRIVVLAHDGPTGLGAARSDVFGRDFRTNGGDWGDPDLRLVLDAAQAAQRPVVAVVAGHMHHAMAGGGLRTTCVRDGGVLVLNAAVVPRVRADGWRALHVLSLLGERATARLEWHGPGGEVVVEPLAESVAAVASLGAPHPAS